MRLRPNLTGGKQQRFAWDGKRIIAINKDLLEEGYTAAGMLSRWPAQTAAAAHTHSFSLSSDAAAAVYHAICPPHTLLCLPFLSPLRKPLWAAAGRLHDFIARLQHDVRSSFIPRTEDVTEDYWEWVKWRCAQVSLGLPQSTPATAHACACWPCDVGEHAVHTALDPSCLLLRAHTCCSPRSGSSAQHFKTLQRSRC
jgi:hypothetical protein